MMASLKNNKNSAEIDISYHKVTNKIDDSFVGIKIKSNKIDFYYPETYHFDDSSLEKSRNDVLAILQTISIAKTHSDSRFKVESSFSNNEAIPLLSYLWTIKDYLKNGFYVNREKVLKKNQRGKVDWKRTINGQPIISKGNVIYSDIVVSVKNNLDNLIAEIHRYCVKKSLDMLGWLFRINSSSFIQTKPFYGSIKNLYIDALNKELNQTFDDEKKERLEHMVAIVEGLSEEQNTNELVYGVDSYSYIFERMINSIFGNRDASKFNPSANWHLKSDGYVPFPSSDLRPDTILIHDRIAYVLDSKFYRYGHTFDKKDLPETSSIQKQITYGDFIKTRKLGSDIQKIRNAFILPYDMQSTRNPSNLSNKIEYIGYSKTDYREGIDDHEIVHAFLIDLKYVVNTWNRKNHSDDVFSLVRQIEEIQSTQIKSEKARDYVRTAENIKETQTFDGGISNSFYATLTNVRLKESLENKEILFVDGFFVINDRKYIDVSDGKKHLSEYASRNMKECCLAFENVESPNNNFPFDFCKNCQTLGNSRAKQINSKDSHNDRIFLRAQDTDLDRILEDNESALETKKKIAGSFSYGLKFLMDEQELNPNRLNKLSRIDNKKISKLMDGEVMPNLKEAVALCAALDLHPIVAHQLLANAGFDLKSAYDERNAFYDFLITYCSGEGLFDWTGKIGAINKPEWQIP